MFESYSQVLQTGRDRRRAGPESEWAARADISAGTAAATRFLHTDKDSAEGLLWTPKNGLTNGCSCAMAVLSLASLVVACRIPRTESRSGYQKLKPRCRLASFS